MDPELERLKREFQRDEFRFLTGEIRGHVDEQFKLERYTLIGVFAIYAWLLTKTSTEFSVLNDLAFWLPPVLVTFAMLRSLALLATLELQYDYIKTIENSLLGADGWQHFVVQRRKVAWREWIFRTSLIFFWIALFAMTMFIAWHSAPLGTLALSLGL